MSAGIHDWDAQPEVELAPGVLLRALWTGAVMTTHVTWTPGAEVPEHDHPHDQIGTVLEGTLRLSLAGERHVLRAGAAFCVPGGVRHGGVAGPHGCVLIESFAPVREDYVARIEA